MGSPVKRQFWIFILLIVCLHFSDGAAQEPTVSRYWVDFYGSAVWSDQVPIEAGTLIEVFDSDSMFCGKFTITDEGVYGFMAVYGDDPLTPDVDEGAEEGDELYFQINSFPVQILYGGSAVWSQQHLKIPVNLISTITKIDNDNSIPQVFSLDQNFPNPFNPVTSIPFQIPRKWHVTLTIYKLLGQKVNTIIDEMREPGKYNLEWNGQDDYGSAVSSGIYLYRLEAGDFVETRKLIFQK